MLERAGVSFERTDAEENAELCSRFGVRQAPTLVVADGEGFERIVNLSNIKKYAEQARHA